MASPRHNPTPGIRRRVSRRCAGFTLIEAALTTVIIGTGVLAIVAAQQAYHMQNDWAQRTGTAQHLANELRELTLTLPMYHPVTNAQTPGLEPGSDDIADYHALIDFAGAVSGGQGEGVTFSPPVSALRLPYDELDNWSQHVEVYNVHEDWISISPHSAPPLGTTDVMRVRVRVAYEGPLHDEPETISELTWVVGR